MSKFKMPKKSKSITIENEGNNYNFEFTDIGHQLIFEEYYTDQESAIINEKTPLGNILNQIKKGFLKRFGNKVAEEYSFQVELSKDKKEENFIERENSYSFLSGSFIDITDSNKWILVEENSILGFRLNRRNWRGESLYLKIIFFTEIDAVSGSECWQTIENSAHIKLK